MRPRHAARTIAAAGCVAVLAAMWAGPAAAQTVALGGQIGGQMGGQTGGKALLVIDGQPRTLAVGESHAGVRLLALEPGGARVEVAGRAFVVREGAAPIALAAGRAPATGTEVVIPAGPGGHFLTQGAINGRSVRFMVDTGATLVAIGASDAGRLGIDTSRSEPGIARTAGGDVPVRRVMLATLRLGDVELRNVAAVLMPTEMPYVLLGNSALSRFQMRRDNDVMRLELRP